MKMIYISCNVSTLETIKDILDAEKVSSYQIFEQVLSKNPVAAPRFNDPVWPGYSSVLMIPFNNEEQAKALLQILKDYNKRTKNKVELISVCSWNMEDYFFE